MLAHLTATDNLKWLKTEAGAFKPHLVIIGAFEADSAVGHISLQKQKLRLPRQGRVLTRAGQELWEAFVQTFEVEESYRNRGIGTRLQEAAIAESRRLGCYQLRSWSSHDKPANYRVKLRLGFAFHPGFFVVEKTGKSIPGGYFVLKL
jgi:GNAT superfamily N-acetyltransferase